MHTPKQSFCAFPRPFSSHAGRRYLVSSPGNAPWLEDESLVWGGLWLMAVSGCTALVSGFLGVITETVGVLGVLFFLGCLGFLGGIVLLLASPMTLLCQQVCPRCLRSMRRGAMVCLCGFDATWEEQQHGPLARR